MIGLCNIRNFPVMIMLLIMILRVHIMNSCDDYHDMVPCMHEIHQYIVK